MPSGDELKPLTVGDLRAELVGWPDDTPLAVVVPDRDDPDSAAVLPVMAAGLGDGVVPDDPVLIAIFPITVRWHE